MSLPTCSEGVGKTESTRQPEDLSGLTSLTESKDPLDLFSVTTALSREERRHHILQKLVSVQQQLQNEVNTQTLKLNTLQEGMMQLFFFITHKTGEDENWSIPEKKLRLESEGKLTVRSNESSTMFLRFHPFFRISGGEFHSLHELVEKIEHLSQNNAVMFLEAEKEKKKRELTCLVRILYHHIIDSLGLPPSHEHLCGSLRRNTVKPFLDHLMFLTTVLSDQLQHHSLHHTQTKDQKNQYAKRRISNEFTCYNYSGTTSLPHFGNHLGFESEVLPQLFLTNRLKSENHFFTLVLCVNRMLSFWLTLLSLPRLQQEMVRATALDTIRLHLRLALVELEEICDVLREELLSLDKLDKPSPHCSETIVGACSTASLAIRAVKVLLGKPNN